MFYKTVSGKIKVKKNLISDCSLGLQNNLFVCLLKKVKKCHKTTHDSPKTKHHTGPYTTMSQVFRLRLSAQMLNDRRQTTI